ncbi:MAG: molybdate ABC transporter substrate-binding protein [Rhodobacteraceae bacterium]|nr:molybdate ABC transporter substrate-binding protein [Paracoccaceae bacterium]
MKTQWQKWKRAAALGLGLAVAQVHVVVADPVVFAASSMKTALDDIASAYVADTGQSVVLSHAGSSALARQIDYGAPADVFISANTQWMAYLLDRGKVDRASQFALASNRLALIAPAGWVGELRPAPGFPLSDFLGSGYLAMALVDSVPAGIYGRDALQALGIWDQVVDRVAQTYNARSALRLVATGDAPFGIVFATDAQAEPAVRLLGLFPPSSHEQILYPVARTTSASDTADAFLDYLRSDTAKTILARHGFLSPGWPE